MTRIPDRPTHKPPQSSSILADWRPEGWAEVLKAVEGGMGYEAACRSVGVSAREMRHFKNRRPGGKPPRIPEMERELEAAKEKAAQREQQRKPDWWSTVLRLRAQGSTVSEAMAAVGLTQADVYDLISPRGGSGKIRRPDLREEWQAASEQAQQQTAEQVDEQGRMKTRLEQMKEWDQIKTRLGEVKAQIRLGYSPQAAAKSLGLDHFDAFLQANPDVADELTAPGPAPSLPEYRVWVRYLLGHLNKEITIAKDSGDEAELFDLELLRDVVEDLDVTEIEVRLPALRNRLLKRIGRRYDYREDLPEGLREG